MAQTLLLGLGGTGSRIVNHVAAELKRKHIAFNDGNICCAVLDTNDNDRKKVSATGVGIPVIGTSKERKIEEYLKIYAPKGVDDWMPQSPALLKESMKDGASQMRTKSRLAFFDALETRKLQELESIIESMFTDRQDQAKIRVMLVSSLAGGTGSGMFIQTALWLRKFFAKRRCDITLRGIFVLPDVFIKTIKDIRDDETEIQSLYANAYGAIRELNAITKIKTKGLIPLHPVKVDGLFDSEKGQPDGQPVFDYAFFIDDISEGGSVLEDIDHYEQVAARLVYMQLYAPMHDDLYSEEDNLFKRFQKSSEPVFGSCGTAKAIYPTEDILRYCALRAAQDSLSTGWRRIDDEIKAKQEKEDERERSGAPITARINPRAEYVRLFDAKAAKTGDQVGTDRLFLEIAHDIMDEEHIPGEDGKAIVNYLDKIDEFIAKLDTLIDQEIDTRDVGDLSGLKLKKGWAEDKTGDSDRKQLVQRVETLGKKVRFFLEETDASVEAIAEELLDTICPVNMGDINQANEGSVYGLLTKLDDNNERYFVHPIAVRYLCYKLAARLDEIKQESLLDQKRGAAEKGYGCGKKKIEFDNARTGAVEDSPLDYLNSHAFLQNEAKFIETFKSLYAQHNATQHELCRSYAIASLKNYLAIALSKRLEALTSTVEEFFKNLVKVSNTLEDAVAENIRKNGAATQKMVYICASAAEKEELYRSMRFNTAGSDNSVNGIIVRALFGKFCAGENPNAEANKEYVDRSVENTFYKEVTETYAKTMLTKNREDVDLDIFTAVCKSADIAYAEEQKSAYRSESDRLNVDLETGETVADTSRHDRHVDAMQELARRLFDMSAPFLISNDEQPEDPSEHTDGIDDEDDELTFTPIKKRKTFWGFHPLVAEQCPELGRILGVNVKSQQNDKYRKNELDCYRAVYGIQAGYVEKFNELQNGDYYRNYRQVVRGMIAGMAEGRTEELIHTPHLDKTWHLFLPYITPEKQREEDEKFYRLFWLAVAYGMISLSAHGKYQILRTKKMAAGEFHKNEPILYNGETIGMVDVLKLMAALQVDGAFMVDAAKLEKRFKEECEKLDNYEGTDLLRGHAVKDDKGNKATVGGLASKGDMNAITLIVRYYKAPRHSDEVAAMMIRSLEKLMRELVTGMYGEGEQNKILYKGYELCNRVYDASALKDKGIELLSHWKEARSRSSFED